MGVNGKNITENQMAVKITRIKMASLVAKIGSRFILLHKNLKRK
jgi:hypothetical protein